MTKRMERIIKGLQECREELNNFIEDLCRRDSLTGFTCDKWDSYKSRAVPVLKAFGDFLKELEGMGAKWIPVTQRLPENRERVIVTFEQKYGDSKYGVAIDCVKNGKWRWEEEFPEGDIKVVAWMPFPKPWSGEVKG